jgi:predicted DNA-binding transcriptional regulator AlpA
MARPTVNLVHTRKLRHLPRFIRLRDAPNYLGMDRNRFNRIARPYLVVIPIGKQGVAFDRLDLDDWADQYKSRNGRPAAERRKPWDE